MSDYGLIPSYTEVDFQTLVDRLKTILSKTDTFKDYDFEGANITLILELLSYIGDLNTFYTNRLAQNLHTETANIYEVVHSLVRQQGYVPTGYISSEVTVTITVRRRNNAKTVTYFEAGNQLYIPKWFKVNTGLTDDDGNIVYYCMPDDYTFDVTVDNIQTGYDADLEQSYEYVEFDVVMKQGEPLQTPSIYTGADIISNQIVLPFQNWDMGLYPYESTKESILVTVGTDETVWTRVSDFFDDLSGLSEENNAYIFYYDKYKRAVLSFSSTRNIPSIDDEIKVYLIKSLGSNGVISANTFDESNKPVIDTIYGEVDVPFLRNISTDVVVPADRYSLSNDNASVGGSDPETIDELKIGGQAYAHSQLRNVTKNDYIGNLESRGDVEVANVWGEQEQNPGVLDTTYYNRAYISLIPTEWESDTYNNIKMLSFDVDDVFSNNTEVTPKQLPYPINYNNEIQSVSSLVDNTNGTLVDGTYTDVATTTDGYGEGATLDVVISGGVFDTVTLNNGGLGYAVDDTLYVSESDVSWSDGGGSINVVVSAVVGDEKVYNPNWETQLFEYLEPRRMLGIWEELVLPELVYFRFDFGLKVKRSYSWTSVKETIKNKLVYYFRNSNRNFGETIDFREVYNYIMDLGNVSDTDDFSLIRGIQSLVIRDIMIHRIPTLIEDITNEETCTALGGYWDSEQSLIGSDTALGDTFGRSIAMSGDGMVAVVGATKESTTELQSGAVYVFEKMNDVFSQTAKIKADTPVAYSEYATSVAITDDKSTIAVGSNYYDTTYNVVGAVYIYTKVNGTWTEQQIITPSVEADYIGLGASLKFSSDGNILFVGAPSDNTSLTFGGGSTFIFKKVSGVWTETQKIISSGVTENGHFGFSVDCVPDGSVLVVGDHDESTGGSYAGAVYIYTTNDFVTWTEYDKLQASDISADFSFGKSVSISDDGLHLIVGANGANSDSGAVYYFFNNLGVWSELQKITIPTSYGDTSDFFGDYLAIDGDATRIVIGALNEDALGSNTGQVYIYYYDSGSWSLLKTFYPDDISAGDTFGSAVAISDDGANILAASRNKDSSTGGVYAYRIERCSVSSSIDPMYIYEENIQNYFPQFLETGYTANSLDDVYNTIQPIRLGYNQFPQLAIDFCKFTNEG